ncbi:hypothetical protein AVEN_165282-1 [Araneus ventricosus]|uniref:Uncharacterized protein n=1 Tax=Araneus ventricosus TaxID=182803 RepID=A0A4Y2AUU5_ARAVE|nr:hypothetical protein AVEN_165282-1 [Araneus ventricosus]
MEAFLHGRLSQSANNVSQNLGVTSFNNSASELRTNTINLPMIKLEPFRGHVEEWQCFGERFKSSIDDNSSLTNIDKHVFLRGYLQDEPKRLVAGISVTANTYETTNKIMIDKYGNKNRIIQAHVDALENLTPIHTPTPSLLSNLYIECNRRIQALRALGENVENYSRVFPPKVDKN